MASVATHCIGGKTTSILRKFPPKLLGCHMSIGRLYVTCLSHVVSSYMTQSHMTVINMYIFFTEKGNLSDDVLRSRVPVHIPFIHWVGK